MASRHRRDPVFDLWRGIALVDMAWVHLATYPIGMPAGAATWIGEYTRFAAGAFVLLSGLTVRLAFGPGLASPAAEVRRATTVRLLRRSALLLLVDRLAGALYASIEAMVAGGSGFDPSRILSIAVFREPGVTGGLLLLHAMLLLGTAPLELLRARAGDVTVVALSVAAFAAAQWHGNAAHWPPWTFPLLHWQSLFVLGYLATPSIRRGRASGSIFAPAALGATTSAVVVLFLLRNPAVLGLDPLVAMEFRKVPLNPAELAWYVAASAFVLAWSARLHDGSGTVRRASRWLQRIGRWSLLLYVAHLLLEIPIVAFLTAFDPSPALRATMLIVMIAALDAVARTADAVKRRRTSGSSLLWPLPAIPAGGIVGGVVAAISIATVLVLPAGPPEELAVGERADEVVLEELEPERGEAEDSPGTGIGIVDAEVQVDDGRSEGVEELELDAPEESPSMTLPIDELIEEDVLPIAN